MAEAPPRRIALIGAVGRMGQAILRALPEGGGLSLGAAVVRPGHARVGRPLAELGLPGPAGAVFTDDLGAALGAADVAVDVSAPGVTARVARAAAGAGIPLVTGTTGLKADDLAALAEAAAAVPVLVAPNLSVGIAVLKALVREAALRLGPGWDGEILEIHHRAKKDSPSGTATALGEALAAARGAALPDVEIHRGRGLTGPRADPEIGIAALRGGSVPGEHTVFFFGPDERLELTHRAGDRAIFARGALRAARWIVDAAPGRYGMDDVLAPRA